jgi:hypothetical protein
MGLFIIILNFFFKLTATGYYRIDAEEIRAD